MNILKLHAVEKGLKELRLPVDSIVDYYSYDEREDHRMVSEEEMELIAWSVNAVRFLKKSKAVDAKKLIEEHKTVIEKLMEEIEVNTSGGAYTIINTGNNRFSVKESVHEIDEMINKIEYNERLGL